MKGCRIVALGKEWTGYFVFKGVYMSEGWWKRSPKSEQVQLSQQVGTAFSNSCASSPPVRCCHIAARARFCCPASLPRCTSITRPSAADSAVVRSPQPLPPCPWNEDNRLGHCKWCVGRMELDINKLAPALLQLMMPLMMTSQDKLGRLTFPDQELTSGFLGLWTGKLIWGFTTSCCAWKQRAVIHSSEVHNFKIVL